MAKDNSGPKPLRPGLVKTGTVGELEPVTELTANFSPMLRSAPPPLDRSSRDTCTRKLSSEVFVNGDISSTAGFITFGRRRLNVPRKVVLTLLAA